MPTTTSTFCQGNMSHQTKGFLVLFCWLLQLLEDLFCFAVQFSHVQWTALSCAPILAVRKRLLQGLERVCSTACVRRTRKSSCNKERASTKKIALKCSVISSSLRARFVSSSPPLLSSSSPPPLLSFSPSPSPSAAAAAVPAPIVAAVACTSASNAASLAVACSNLVRRATWECANNACRARPDVARTAPDCPSSDQSDTADTAAIAAEVGGEPPGVLFLAAAADLGEAEGWV